MADILAFWHTLLSRSYVGSMYSTSSIEFGMAGMLFVFEFILMLG